jgi:hypothetical protein
VTARNSGLMPIAGGEVDAAGLLIAVEIAGSTLPVALLRIVSVCIVTKIALGSPTPLQ